MTFDIKIGESKLNMIDRVSIKRSVLTLGNTAAIVLPGTMHNKELDVKSKLKIQDKVTIKLGYDSNLKTEFEGYLTKITIENGTIQLECEDDLQQYRKKVKNKQFLATSVKNILEYVTQEVSSECKVVCSNDIQYEKFIIHEKTGYDILKTIQNDLSVNIYIKDKELHAHAMGSKTHGDATYNFATNIESDNLRYKTKEERKVKVKVSGDEKDEEGKLIMGESGSDEGDEVSRKISGMSSANLEKIAKEIHGRSSFDGCEGTFRAWLIPYCDAGYEAIIKNDEDKKKEGTYYVAAVDTEFSESGAVRTISLGKKM